MDGDLYHVRYRLVTDRGTYTAEAVFDNWADAKEHRNHMYFNFPNVSHVWIERSNPSLGLQTERRGEVMKRKEPDV